MENEPRNCPECGWLNGQCDCEGEPPVRSSELVRCPNPHCENGAVDTGGSTPWGAWISDKCGICDGRGHITKEEDEAMQRASNGAHQPQPPTTPKQSMQNKLTKTSALAAVGCMCLFGGCKPSPLVEVTIENVWTTEQYRANWSMKATFPHVIATRKDTGERVMILRDTWGKPGDTFKISADRIMRP